VIRFVLLLLLAIFVVWCGTTVKLGDYTCAGHVKRIWNSEETKDLRKGVKEKATSESTEELVDDIKDKTAPVVDKVKRGVEAGVKEVSKDGDKAPAQPAESPAK
jgi:hypothetical protein